MVRWSWLVIAIIVILGGGWVWWQQKEISSDYRGYSDLSKIRWSDVINGKQVMVLYGWENIFGRFGGYGEEVGLARVSYNPRLIGKYGYTGLSIEPKMIEIDGVENGGMIFSKPYRLIGYMATSVGESEMVVMYVGWKSYDGEYGIVTYIIPRAIYEQESYPTRMNKFLHEQNERPLMPVTHIVNTEKCLELASGNGEYCEWYWQNKAVIEDLVIEWAATRELPIRLSKYPLLVNW